MSLISNVLEAAFCSGTHHKLALHSLNYLRGDKSASWTKFFQFHQGPFIKGSKVPDKVFKDFKNHVCHVQSGNWGGAPSEAQSWYDLTVDELRAGNWAKAAYSAGVLSHYVTDPVMPFHTAQSEAETNIHRAVEWSVNKSYNSLRAQIDSAAAAADIEPDGSSEWLQNLVIEAARSSNQSYQILIDHYDFKQGSENPPEGFDQTCRDHIAKHLGYAQVLQARILDRAIEEAAVTPPQVNLTLNAIIAALTIPIAWVTRKMTDAAEIKLVRSMYIEFEETGRVDKYLTDDVRVIRDMVNTPTDRHEKIVKMPQKSKRRSRGLQLDSNLEAAPSIGPKTAATLAGTGLFTIQDLLNADPETVSREANRSRITAQTIRDWQDQARLANQIPQLRGHDVQILIGGGIRSLTELAQSAPEDLLANVTPFVESEAGQRVVKPGNEPDFDEVKRWIELAESAA